MKIPTGIKKEYEYEVYFKYDGDKSYWTTGSYRTLKMAVDCINQHENLVDWKIVKVTKTYKYDVVKESR